MCKLVWHLLKTLVYFFRKLPHLWQLLWIDPFTTWAEAISHCLHKYNDQTHVWSWPENYFQKLKIQRETFFMWQNLNTSTRFCSNAFLLLDYIHFFIASDWMWCIWCIGYWRQIKTDILQKLKQNLSISLNFITDKRLKRQAIHKAWQNSSKPLQD